MKAYLKNEISGTDFIELQKGKYKNLHFKEDSIYFCEEDFAVIMYDITTGVAAVVTKVEIGDVLFYYPTTGIEIIMCKINWQG